MPKVIDAEKLIAQKEKLPTEAFFVDTNSIVYFIDPFGESNNNNFVAELNPKLARLFNYLKNSCKSFCTIEIAFEYYNHVKYGTMKNFRKIDPTIEHSDFKRLRKIDNNFQDIWEQRIRKFKKVFEKQFILHKSNLSLDTLTSSYSFENDFIDHIFYNSIMSLPQNLRCIVTYDEDFYNYSGDYFLLTYNEKIIAMAKKENKLYY